MSNPSDYRNPSEDDQWVAMEFSLEPFPAGFLWNEYSNDLCDKMAPDDSNGRNEFISGDTVKHGYKCSRQYASANTTICHENMNTSPENCTSDRSGAMTSPDWMSSINIDARQSNASPISPCFSTIHQIENTHMKNNVNGAKSPSQQEDFETLSLVSLPYPAYNSILRDVLVQRDTIPSQSYDTSAKSRSDSVESCQSEEALEEWTEQEIEMIMQNQLDPVGKFLGSMNISPRQVIELGLMDTLQFAPKKTRVKYGPRKELSTEERIRLNRERNRMHARATRFRKKLFKQVLTETNIPSKKSRC